MPQPHAPLQRLSRLLGWVRRPEFLVFLPAITLAGFWMGGERVLLLLALGLPLLFAVTGSGAGRALSQGSPGEDAPSVGRAISAMDAILPALQDSGRNTCLLYTSPSPRD